MICMATILHRQWSVHERLSYPMTQLPLQMIEGTSPGQVAPFFLKKLMWLGFAVPFILFSFSGLNHYLPVVPEFPFYIAWIHWFRDVNTWGEGLALSYAWLGFFYLVDLNISLSIWFFFLIGKFQDGLFRTLGIHSTEQLSQYEYSQLADLTHQAVGASIVFVLFGLWTARHHLRDVVATAWRPASGVDDSEELMSYRLAFFGLIASLLFVCFWLWRSGLPPVVIPVFSLYLSDLLHSHHPGRLGRWCAHSSPPASGTLFHHLGIRHFDSGRQRHGSPVLYYGVAGGNAPLPHARLRQRAQVGRIGPRLEEAPFAGPAAGSGVQYDRRDDDEFAPRGTPMAAST